MAGTLGFVATVVGLGSHFWPDAGKLGEGAESLADYLLRKLVEERALGHGHHWLYRGNTGFFRC